MSACVLCIPISVGIHFPDGTRNRKQTLCSASHECLGPQMTCMCSSPFSNAVRGSLCSFISWHKFSQTWSWGKFMWQYMCKRPVSWLPSMVWHGSFLYSFCMRLCTISLSDTLPPTCRWEGVWLTINYSVLKPIILFSQICNIASQTAILGESFQTLCIQCSTLYLSSTCVGGTIASFWIRWTWLLKMFIK